MPYEMVKLPPWWLRGLPADLWLQHGRIVEKFITEQKLKPVDPKFLVTKLEVLAGQPQAVATATATAKARLNPIDALHYG